MKLTDKLLTVKLEMVPLIQLIKQYNGKLTRYKSAFRPTNRQKMDS